MDATTLLTNTAGVRSMPEHLVGGIADFAPARLGYQAPVGGELKFTPRPEVDRDPSSGPAIESCPVSQPRQLGPAGFAGCRASDSTVNGFAVVVVAKLQDLAFEINAIPEQGLIEKLLAHGFARSHCGGCGRDFLIAFSCKGRGVCPSCNARRMVETAAHLVDHVFRLVPVRKRLRYFLQP